MKGLQRRADIASLQSSQMGVPLYEKMGFQKICSYKDYARPG